MNVRMRRGLFLAIVLPTVFCAAVPVAAAPLADARLTLESAGAAPVADACSALRRASVSSVALRRAR